MACEWQQKAESTCRIRVPSMLQMHRIPHMPGVAFDVRREADAQIDSSKFLSALGVNHPKMVCRNSVNLVRREPD